MSRRSRAREVALQSLYRVDVGGAVEQRDRDRFHRGRLRSADLAAFADALVDGVGGHCGEIDALLDTKSVNWKVSRMAATDRAVLRLAVFELLHTDTPGPVVVDEAIELARRYGSVDSPAFVAGILGAILADRDGRPAGLTRFDGDGWAEVTPLEGDDRIAIAGLDVGADGTLWAVLVPDHDHARAHLARWDGETWAAWRLPSLMSDKHGLPFGLQAAPDGRLWMLVWDEDPVATQRFDATRMLFDGEAWVTLDMRAGVGADQNLTFAPDGSAWFAQGKTGYKVIPSDLERLEEEAAEPYVPA